MDELIKSVVAKTGISEALAKTAVNTVLEFVKGKLPPAIGSQLNNILDGKGDVMSDITKGIGGLFGGK